MIETFIKGKYSDLRNLRGWKTRRRIIVLESDDWGSIRMPDRATYNILLSKGVRVDKCPFMRIDSLESEEDLSALFDVLNKFRDINGNPPVITANCVMANPDFEKIRDSGYSGYYYELFTDTLQKYPGRSHSFDLWKEGIEKELFFPQFHGREHLNIERWMKALRANLQETRLAFDLKLFGISKAITTENRESYLEAYSFDTIEDFNKINSIIIDGLGLFRNTFGFTSESFIAPNYVWPAIVEENLANEGVRYIQGQRIQFSPDPKTGNVKKLPHYTGQRNRFAQIYTVRNCVFEPSLNETTDCVDECLSQVSSAFRWRKPAIITSHRLNFIGAIEPSNRDRNLKSFGALLNKILLKWPDVEFMTTPVLGEQIDLRKF